MTGASAKDQAEAIRFSRHHVVDAFVEGPGALSSQTPPRARLVLVGLVLAILVVVGAVAAGLASHYLAAGAATAPAGGFRGADVGGAT